MWRTFACSFLLPVGSVTLFCYSRHWLLWEQDLRLALVPQRQPATLDGSPRGLATCLCGRCWEHWVLLWDPFGELALCFPQLTSANAVGLSIGTLQIQMSTQTLLSCLKVSWATTLVCLEIVCRFMGLATSVILPYANHAVLAAETGGLSRGGDILGTKPSTRSFHFQVSRKNHLVLFK